MSNSFPDQSSHPYESLYAICRPLECPSAPSAMHTHGHEEAYCLDIVSISTNSNTIDTTNTRATTKSTATMARLSPSKGESPETHEDYSTSSSSSVDSDDILALLKNPGFEMDAFLAESDSDESKERHEPSSEEDAFLETQRRRKHNGNVHNYISAIAEEKNCDVDDECEEPESESTTEKNQKPSPEKDRKKLKHDGDVLDCIDGITEEEEEVDGDNIDGESKSRRSSSSSRRSTLSARKIKYNGDVLDFIGVITEEEEGGKNIDMELMSACSANTSSSSRRKRRQKFTVETQMSHYFPRPVTNKRPRKTTIRYAPQDNRSSSSIRLPAKKRNLVKEASLVSKSVDRHWFQMYGRLVEYKKRRDGSFVVTPNKEDKELSEWASDQRYKLSKNQLAHQQVALLDEIGFMNGAKGEDRTQWYIMYARLLDYKNAHGDHWRGGKLNRHCDVDPQLGLWAEHQISLKKKDGLLPERRKLLENIGFRWSRKTGFDKWMQMYDQLVAYHQMYGTTVVGKHGPDVAPLRNWINRQRHFAKRGGLTEIRTRLLNKIGFVWDYSNCYAEAIAAAANNSNNSNS